MPCMFFIADIDDCEFQPCQNNGTCVDLVNEYQCYCGGGFNGTNCTIGNLHARIGITGFHRKIKMFFIFKVPFYRF